MRMPFPIDLGLRRRLSLLASVTFVATPRLRSRGRSPLAAGSSVAAASYRAGTPPQLSAPAPALPRSKTEIRSSSKVSTNNPLSQLNLQIAFRRLLQHNSGPTAVGSPAPILCLDGTLERREAEAMFFTHLGRVVAILVLILAFFHILAGWRVLTPELPLDSELARYLSRALERGIYLLAFSIVLGILTEISYALKSLKVP